MSGDIHTVELAHTEACPLCSKPTGRVLAKELRRGTGMVYFCSSCEHGFLIQEKPVDPKSYYAELYRQEYSHNAEAAATNAREIFDVYRHYQHVRLEAIAPHLTPTAKLLEVGASAGQFLVHVRDRVAQADAIELDKDCCEFLRSELGIRADSEFLEQSAFANERYDVVCSFQVMEHVAEPATFLKNLRQSTKAGGDIFVEVPSLRDPLLSVWNVKTYRKFFYHSAHLHYFTERSLQNVAAAAGFLPDEIEVSHTQDYNLLNHLHWIMNDGPQANCYVGLNDISFDGENQEISSWLTGEMRNLNEQYLARLVAAKSTSNMMMKLKNGK